VLDAFSRRVVGWAMADHRRTELVLDALGMALRHRNPHAGLIHPSDHGCQYTSLAFGQQVQAAGLVPSMGSVGDCFDNAVAESFFATLKVELLHRRVWPTRAAARLAIFEFIEVWYNRRLRERGEQRRASAGSVGAVRRHERRRPDRQGPGGGGVT
jgi:transposase InsO family protein